VIQSKGPASVNAGTSIPSSSSNSGLETDQESSEDDGSINDGDSVNDDELVDDDTSHYDSEN
jgi:hypothetical protein